MKKLLVIDNYDSFTYNLVQMFMDFELDIAVHRNDNITLDGAAAFSPDYILISPGPRTPADSGISMPLIKEYYRTTPILGVCLGMQCINEVFGGKTVKGPVPVHGKTSLIFHDSKGVFRNMPQPFRAARYHSLVIERGGAELSETARTKDGIIMGIEHSEYPLYGVQFHPESFMTRKGSKIIQNFLGSG